MNSVIPVLTGARLYAVRSASKPGEWHMVDLGRDRCTCTYCQFHPYEEEKLCRPRREAVAFEAEQREVQEKMPLVTARLKHEAQGKPYAPKLPELTEEEYARAVALFGVDQAA